MSAAAAATIMMTAAPMARYVVVGLALVGGTTAADGEVEVVVVCAGEVEDGAVDVVVCEGDAGTMDCYIRRVQVY